MRALLASIVALLLLIGSGTRVGGAVLAIPIARWLFNGGKTFQLPGGVDIGLLELSDLGRVLKEN